MPTPHRSATPSAKPAEVARPPFWAEKGVYVYRISTPDEPRILPNIEKGVAIVSNMLDGTVPQVVIVNGLIGHDHTGPWNWDGLWPYLERVTFRAGDFNALSEFMTRAKTNSNVYTTFHVNLTDVNIGLRDYPETQAYFKKLVETKSIYRRDRNPQTNKRDLDPPYVPQEIDRYISNKNEKGAADPVPIFALVNYKNYWDSGLARQTIDGLYSKLPYAPPLLYLDVLTLAGGNFATGFPTGELGGSEETQLEGVNAIIDYLRSKGSDLATEGSRPFLGKNAQGNPRAGYNWYHGAGFSNDDYSVISGGAKLALPSHQVFGSMGANNVSPIACTEQGIQTVRAHYDALLQGKPGTKKLPGLDTWHISRRPSDNKVDEFDIPGANGDIFRGDWADMINYFYLCVVQENFHIGKRNIRKKVSTTGVVHIGSYYLSNAGAADEAAVLVADFSKHYAAKKARDTGFFMLEEPIETKVSVGKAGTYQMRITYRVPGRSQPMLNVYVNGKLAKSMTELPMPKEAQSSAEANIGDITLNEGENSIAVDGGPIRASWSDGTRAEWTTPYLRSGFKVYNGDVTYAIDYDRMWPDTWSGQKKIYLYSWDGTARTWKLPEEWRTLKEVTIQQLTPAGRGTATRLEVREGSVTPKLLPQIPYILLP
ncbi:MAG: glycoside hydrolase family 101 beta sandwich domain-containing protein [Candidatus Methylacidiphilales bacterium]|nr:glycoside hydrolase family 101 beta sandwich domain-containing protein [Candidatus Methylacidiphilales bacterium]